MVSQTETEESLVLASIKEWAETPTPDHARALIRLYQESEWRSTRLEVLRGLGRFYDSRSLQFLIEVAEKNEDLSEQHLAFLGISQRKTKSAQVYLKAAYLSASDTLKPHLAYTLGQVQDHTMIPVLLKDWDLAYQKQELLWLRNIILSLGDLKAHEALPKMTSLLSRSQSLNSEVVLALLFAIARLEREVDFLLPLERQFSENSLLFQVFQSTLSQVQIRSQFKLEDYLAKIFNSPDPHPILPLELRAFDPEEVELGLSIFNLKQDWSRFLFALHGVSSLKRVKYLEQIIPGLETSEEKIQFLTRASKLIDDINQAQFLRIVSVFSSDQDPWVRLKCLECLAPFVEVSRSADSFLGSGQKDPSVAIQYLNLWSEWSLIRFHHQKDQSENIKVVQEWLKKYSLLPSVFARLIRAVSELGIEVKEFSSHFAKRFKEPELRASFLMLVERMPGLFDFEGVTKALALFTPLELENLGPRILAVFEAYAELQSQAFLKNQKVGLLLKTYAENENPELKIGVLKVLRNVPLKEWEAYVIDQVSHAQALVQLNAVITLKKYADSTLAGEVLREQLKAPSKIIQGRALDSLCNHATLIAKNAVMDYLKLNLQDEGVVDKVYRSFDPMKRGGEAFVKAVDAILNQNPDHPQWEKLLSLRDRLSLSSLEAGREVTLTEAPVNPSLKEMDQALIKVIPLFGILDSMTQSALRAAETPFLLALDEQNLPVDKAPTVLEYCKALDLILERHLGQKHLFPKLDRELHDFQTLWHRVGFQEDYPELRRVMEALGLTGKMTPESFPLHKARLMSATFFNGKILQDRFKVFDGLRAWAVIFLIFTRKLDLPGGSVGPLLKLPHFSDEKCIMVAKKLMSLQDLRNPAAHRQTYTDLSSVEKVRNEAILLLNTILGMVG